MNTLKSIISLTALLFGIFTATAADELTYKWARLTQLPTTPSARV